jgi:hypothetical protein
MEHTALPWDAVIATRRDGGGKELLILPAGQRRIIAKISPDDKMDEQDEPNARFIVRAVNSHYELVGALKRLQHWVLPSDPDADIIRAALKKAGAE